MRNVLKNLARIIECPVICKLMLPASVLTSTILNKFRAVCFSGGEGGGEAIGESVSYGARAIDCIDTSDRS